MTNKSHSCKIVQTCFLTLVLGIDRQSSNVALGMYYYCQVDECCDPTMWVYLGWDDTQAAHGKGVHHDHDFSMAVILRSLSALVQLPVST